MFYPRLKEDKLLIKDFDAYFTRDTAEKRMDSLEIPNTVDPFYTREGREPASCFQMTALLRYLLIPSISIYLPSS